MEMSQVRYHQILHSSLLTRLMAYPTTSTTKPAQPSSQLPLPPSSHPRTLPLPGFNKRGSLPAAQLDHGCWVILLPEGDLASQRVEARNPDEPALASGGAQEPLPFVITYRLSVLVCDKEAVKPYPTHT